MLTYIEVTGKNDEEALAKGLAQLGMDRDDVSVEILDRGKTGFLGIGSVPARVKITYEVPDPPKEEPAPVTAPRPEPQGRQEPPKAKESQPRPKGEEKPRPEKTKAEENPKPEKAKADKPKPAPTIPEKPKAGKPRQEKPRPAPPKPEKPRTEPQPVGEEDEVAQAIRAFQTGLLSHMGVEATPVIRRGEDAYEVVLEGEDIGALIGRRGETLDAIQQLTGYAVNKGRSKRVRIHVDAEGYRARREESLQRMAKKTAAKVVKYHRSVTLEVMNAYERHVIHAALQDFPGVTTYSTGTEPNRRTVIAYDPSKK